VNLSTLDVSENSVIRTYTNQQEEIHCLCDAVFVINTFSVGMHR